MSSSPTGWRDSADNGPLYAAGMVMFGATLLGIVGIFEFLQGISALRTDKVFVHGDDYVYSIDVTAWGWIHVVVGALAVLVAVGLFMDWPWAGWAGLVVCILGAILQFAFMPQYPIWSLVVLGMYALVIWALCYQIRHRHA